MLMRYLRGPEGLANKPPFLDIHFFLQKVFSLSSTLSKLYASILPDKQFEQARIVLLIKNHCEGSLRYPGALPKSPTEGPSVLPDNHH